MHLLNFWTLRVGPYLRWTLTPVLNLHHFQQVYCVYFATKHLMVITKHEDVTKQGFCKYTEENSVFWEVSYWYFFNFNHVNKWILWCCLDNEPWNCTPVNHNNQYYSCALNFGGLGGGSGVGWGWALIWVWVEARRGVGWGQALIRGWALIQILNMLPTL